MRQSPNRALGASTEPRRKKGHPICPQDHRKGPRLASVDTSLNKFTGWGPFGYHGEVDGLRLRTAVVRISLRTIEKNPGPGTRRGRRVEEGEI